MREEEGKISLRVALGITASQIKSLAAECGFELVGITAAAPSEDWQRFEDWRASGFAGEMSYLTDRRGDLRSDPRNLLPQAQSIVCVGKLYNAVGPPADRDPVKGWISRYAWGGSDYHDILREGLTELVGRIGLVHRDPFVWRVCVDTAPLLERSYARAAGLGWIGRNTCLINQGKGSWFFLGEVLLSIALEADLPAADRCGTCRRCIDACPTTAIVPSPGQESGWAVDARLCISYLTIEKRGEIAADMGEKTGNHVFGCDICQDVCPWNGRAAVTDDQRFAPTGHSQHLELLAELTGEDFRHLFRSSPVWRAKYEGFLRNVALAMGNSRHGEMAEPLEKLMSHPNEIVAAAAKQAMAVLLEHTNTACASVPNS